MLRINRINVTHAWVSETYADNFAAPPVLLASPQTVNERDPIVVGIRNGSNSGFEIQLREEKSRDAEIGHVNEQVGYVTLPEGAIVNTAGVQVGECGSFTATTPQRDTWKSHTLSRSYTNPVVVATVYTSNDDTPAVSRLRNISANSFEYQLQEWKYLGNGSHANEIIHYIILESGLHSMPDGTQIIVGTAVTKNDNPVSLSHSQLTMETVVLHQIQTFRGAAPVSSRLDNFSTGGFDLFMQEEEASGPRHNRETIGYIAAIPESDSVEPVNDIVDVARFLAQATFGGTKEEIEQLAQSGYESWFVEQVARPVSITTPYLNDLYDASRALAGQLVRENNSERFPDPQIPWYNWAGHRAPAGNIATAWMRNIVNKDDLFRQRIAWVLSNIFVTSYVGNNQTTRRAGQLASDYYDMLSRNAFGNFRDLLEAITLHPMMSVYLTYLGNEKEDPSQNRYPDENYAREVMQLFSIGLWELRLNGTRKLDGQGNPIPTYDNDVIQELARVFTGFWLKNKRWQKGFSPGSYRNGINLLSGLQMRDDRHDSRSKTLFRDTEHEVVLPATNSGLEDIRNALDVLHDHPNTPPFIAKSLIKLMVTSNPSPAYVKRVAQVFQDNGETPSVRGDMLAVYKAILLDPEARDLSNLSNPNYGRLKEPMVRVAALVRIFKAGKGLPYADVANGLQFWEIAPEDEFFQMPMASPSVFNFFAPSYRHKGALSDAGLDSPEFQILNPISAAATPNRIADMIDKLIHTHAISGDDHGIRFEFDFADELALANDTNALIEHLDLLLCQGQMNEAAKQVMAEGINSFGARKVEDKVKFAVWFAAVSPDGAVLR